MTWSNKTSFKIRGHAGDLCLQFNGAVPTLWLFLTELCRSRTKLAAMFLIIPINKWSQPHRSRRHLMLSLSPCRRKKISVDVSVHLKVQGCCCLGPVRVDNEGPSNSPSASLCFDIYFLCGRGEILQLETSRTTDKHGPKTQAAVQLCWRICHQLTIW